MMVPMEWMLRDTGAFLRHMSARCGLDWGEVTVGGGGAGAVVNPALSDLGYGVLRILNHLDTGTPRWTVRHRIVRPNPFAARVSRLTPDGVRKSQKARMLERISALVGDRYAASNRALSDRLGIDLGACGYRVDGPGRGAAAGDTEPA